MESMAKLNLEEEKSEQGTEGNITISDDEADKERKLTSGLRRKAPKHTRETKYVSRPAKGDPCKLLSGRKPAAKVFRRSQQ